MADAVRLTPPRARKRRRFRSLDCKSERHDDCDGRAYARAGAVADQPCACSCHRRPVDGGSDG